VCIFGGMVGKRYVFCEDMIPGLTWNGIEWNAFVSYNVCA
jgi:hypothetical protein